MAESSILVHVTSSVNQPRPTRSSRLSIRLRASPPILRLPYSLHRHLSFNGQVFPLVAPPSLRPKTRDVVRPTHIGQRQKYMPPVSPRRTRLLARSGPHRCQEGILPYISSLMLPSYVALSPFALDFCSLFYTFLFYLRRLPANVAAPHHLTVAVT